VCCDVGVYVCVVCLMGVYVCVCTCDFFYSRFYSSSLLNVVAVGSFSLLCEYTIHLSIVELTDTLEVSNL
jgi:hypothetical protein